MAKKKPVQTYAKQQLLQSTQFSPVHKDILNALLQEGETCTIEQAKEKIGQFVTKEAK